MNIIIIKIVNFCLELLFPQPLSEKQSEELISKIVKLKREEKDRQNIYPCPAYSFFTYRTPVVRNMIWRLKYRADINVAKTFASKMYDELCEELSELSEMADFKKPLLVPIPISKKKLRSRGFNQSAALCKALTQIDNDRFFRYAPDVLYKIKDTKSQASLKDKNERLKNLKDSFAIKDNAILKTNKNIILLDDVLTTGSTLTEATHILKNAGAEQIIWIVIAH